jgi:uncharacterized protein (TIGR03435 family)
MGSFSSLLQRAILDRPVVDRTGLTGRYDFDLEWAPDETQFGGDVRTSPATSAPPLFTATPQELGLKLEAMRGPVSALVIDGVQRPSAIEAAFLVPLAIRTGTRPSLRLRYW